MNRVGVGGVTLVVAVAVWLLGAGFFGAVVVTAGCALVAAYARVPPRRKVDQYGHRFTPGYHRNG